MEILTRDISKLSAGSPAEVEEILARLTRRRMAKGDFLLQAGQICRQYYFIESGAVRLYYYHGDSDYTVWIGTPGQVFTDLESYLEQIPSRICMEAIEPATVYVIDKETSDALAQQSNAYNTLLRRTVEIAFVNLAKNVMSFQSQAAMERYQRVEAEKDWLLKYPLKYISSFIGVTQSSLSRLRNRKR